MTGSKTNVMKINEVMAAVRVITPASDFVWNGINEDDRPASDEELIKGLALAKNRGRPLGTDKTQIALRVDNSVLKAFKATGKGWQTRMNEALKEWLKEHSAV